MNLLFLVPRLDKASTRYRVLQYLPILEAEGIRTTVKELSRTSRQWPKLLRSIRATDAVFIQKKLFAPLELALVRRFSRRLIYDFDDAVMTKDGPATRFQRARQQRRFGATVRRADLVIAGNAYLAGHARPYNPEVVQLPTPIDLDRYREKTPPGGSNEEIVLGWIGSRGTLKYLQEISPALERLGELYPRLRLKIVADAFFDLEHLPVIKKPWSAPDEIADLHSFDIGLMPLADDPWSRGKCGFKLLQCMAVGLPVICSPVGMNREIVTEGREGFWATSQEEWVDRLSRLISDSDLREDMGRRARAKVEQNYSLAVTAPRLMSYLHE